MMNEACKTDTASDIVNIRLVGYAAVRVVYYNERRPRFSIDDTLSGPTL